MSRLLPLTVGLSAIDENLDQVIERILDLRQQLEDLLEILPEELREEVERRWQQRQAPDAEPPPKPPTGPTVPPEPEPTIADPEPATEPKPLPCGGIHWLDSNQDLVLSGGDRQWRFLRLWFDADDDQILEESEIESLFDLGVRELDVALSFYRQVEGGSGDIDTDQLVWLRQLGKSKNRSGALVVDADRLARDGRVWIVGADGSTLSGLQPLRPATLLENRQGERSPLLCGAMRAGA